MRKKRRKYYSNYYNSIHMVFKWAKVQQINNSNEFDINFQKKMRLNNVKMHLLLYAVRSERELKFSGNFLFVCSCFENMR